MTPPTQQRAEAVHLAQSSADDTLRLVIARVRLLAAMRAAWLHRLWTLEAGEGETALRRITVDRDRLDDEVAWRAAAHELDDLRPALAEVEGRLAGNSGSRLERLGDIFGLDAADRDLMQLTLAFEFDEGLGPVLAHLAGDGGIAHPTPRLAARIFMTPPGSGWRRDGALARWRIVGCEEGDSSVARLVLDPGLRDWFAGGAYRDPALAGVLRPASLHEPLDHWPVGATAAHLQRLVDTTPPTAVRVAVSGVEGVGRQSFATSVARKLGLTVIVAQVGGAAAAAREALAVHVHRHGFLAGAAIVWRDTAAQPPALPADLAPFPVEFVLTGPVDALAPEPGRASLTVSLLPPDAEVRAALWRRYLPDATTWPEDKLRGLAARHRAPPGRIAAAAASAPRSPEEAGAALHALNRHRLGRLAQHVHCPFTRDDLLLPARLAGQLDTLLHEARRRTLFWERPEARRLFPQGHGLIALCTGPAGTGKTMAAQVIARALDLELYRIDVSTVVSKYVGETAENIERILAEAQAMDVVLLFDEADGLFSRRTEVSDAHDRYANTDTGHLLQAIENHDGIVILTSNRKRNIDEAFLRRLRYVMEFPAPDEATREAIWRNLLTELVGADAVTRCEAALKRLAERIPLTGAQIKNAALTAIFSAERADAPLAAAHLLHGVDAELMKEGRALSERDLKQLGGLS